MVVLEDVIVVRAYAAVHAVEAALEAVEPIVTHTVMEHVLMNVRQVALQPVMRVAPLLVQDVLVHVNQIALVVLDARDVEAHAPVIVKDVLLLVIKIVKEIVLVAMEVAEKVVLAVALDVQ